MPEVFKVSKRGFTLIEILVVVAIIGILAALATVSYSAARAQARDAQRKSDLKQIQNALQLYFNENGTYPVSEWSFPGYGTPWIPGLDGKYISKLPVDPKGGPSATCQPRDSTTCFNYGYYSGSWYDLNGRTYILTARLETYTGSDLSQKPYYKTDGTFASNWSESAAAGLLVVQP